MALLVLFSTMSFGISEHFCGNLLVDTSIFSSAETCGMEMEKTTPMEGCSIEKNNCCKDQITLLQSSIFNKEKLINLQNTDIETSLPEASCYSVFYKNSSLKLKYYKDFSPPDIAKDIRVLHQVFLI